MKPSKIEKVADQIIAADVIRAARFSRLDKKKNEEEPGTGIQIMPPARTEPEPEPTRRRKNPTNPPGWRGAVPFWLLAVPLLFAALTGLAIGLAFLGDFPEDSTLPPTSPTVLPSGNPSPTVVRPSASATASPTPGAVVTPSPSPSPVRPIEVTSVETFLESLGVDEASISGLAPFVITEATSDWVEQAPAIDPAQIDIVSGLTFEAGLGSEFLMQFACDGGVVCGANAAGEPGTTLGAPGEYYVALMQLRESPDGPPASDLGYFEIGVVNLDVTPAGGGPAEPFEFGPDSFLTGSNSAWSLRFNPGTKGFDNLLLRLVHGEADQFFHGEDSAAFAVIRGPVVAVFIPEAEWDGTADFRLFSYYQTTAAAAVSDTSPDMTEPMTIYDPTSFPHIGLP